MLAWPNIHRGCGTIFALAIAFHKERHLSVTSPHCFGMSVRLGWREERRGNATDAQLLLFSASSFETSGPLSRKECE